MHNETEEWRVVPSAPGYEVSSFGRLRRRSDGRISAAGPNARGYPNARLTVGGVSSTLYVHRLVAEAFLGAPTGRRVQVAHYDGSRDNNHVANLRWATAPENSADRNRHGTMPRGERNHRSKLSDAQTKAIRQSAERGDILAARFGVADATICRIRGRRRAPNKRSRAEAVAHRDIASASF